LPTLEGEIALDRLGIPVLVRVHDLIVPVRLDEVLEVLAVGRLRVGNVVVGEPSLKLGLMPLVVDWLTC
jgi:hypothetical protein